MCLYVLGRDAENGLNVEEIQKLLGKGKLTPEDIEMSKTFYIDCRERIKGHLPERGHIHSNLFLVPGIVAFGSRITPGEENNHTRRIQKP